MKLCDIYVSQFDERVVPITKTLKFVLRVESHPSESNERLLVRVGIKTVSSSNLSRLDTFSSD